MGEFMRTEEEIQEKLKNVEKEQEDFADLDDTGLIAEEEAMVFEYYEGQIQVLLWVLNKEE